MTTQKKYLIIDSFSYAFDSEDMLSYLYSTSKIIRTLVIENYNIVKNMAVDTLVDVGSFSSSFHQNSVYFQDDPTVLLIQTEEKRSKCSRIKETEQRNPVTQSADPINDLTPLTLRCSLCNSYFDNSGAKF